MAPKQADGTTPDASMWKAISTGTIPWTCKGLLTTLLYAMQDEEVISLAREVECGDGEWSPQAELTLDTALYVWKQTHNVTIATAHVIRLMRVQQFIQDHYEALVSDGYMSHGTVGKGSSGALLTALAQLPYTETAWVDNEVLEYRFSYTEVTAFVREFLKE